MLSIITDRIIEITDRPSENMTKVFKPLISHILVKTADNPPPTGITPNREKSVSFRLPSPGEKPVPTWIGPHLMQPTAARKGKVMRLNEY